MIRWALRRRLGVRIAAIERQTERERRELITALLGEMDAAPVAPEGGDLGSGSSLRVQRLVLGSRLKATCCFWPAGTADLDAAERAMLERTCQNAGMEDGMSVVELGSGWGSLAIWLAEHHPQSRVLAVCATPEEQARVQSTAEAEDLANLEAVATSPLEFEAREAFDRIFAVESLGAIRNQRAMLRRIVAWLRPRGEVLLQVACHRYWPYTFDASDPAHWTATEGGGTVLMPSDDLLYQLEGDLRVVGHSSFSGEHYQRTAEAWLRHLHARKDDVLVALREQFGGRAPVRYAEMRLRYLACSEQFGCHRGQEWWINHYRLAAAG